MPAPKIRKGDRVRVLSGKDRGKEGSVMVVLPKEGRVIVDGVNLAKKHMRPRGRTKQGGIIDKDLPMPASKVAVICPSCGKPTRVGYDINDKGVKVRICRKCGGEI